MKTGFKQNLKIGDLLYTSTSDKHGEFGIIKNIEQYKNGYYDYTLYTYEVVAWETGKKKKCKDLHLTTDSRKLYSMRGSDVIDNKIAEYEEIIKNLKALKDKYVVDK